MKTPKAELRWVLMTFILRYESLKKVSRKDAYEYCEAAARKIYGHEVFGTFDSFRRYVSRNPETPTTAQEIGEIFAKLQEVGGNLPIGEGVQLTTKERDSESPLSARITEGDRLAQDEEIQFLQRVVDAFNREKSRPRRQWTLEEIRKDCERRRKDSRQSFSREVQDEESGDQTPL